MPLPSATATCENCGIRLVIVPPTIGHVKLPEDAPETVQLPDVPEHARLVEAKEDGRFACPACGAEGEAIELRLE
jgi:transcription elongation factor Elf1